MPPFATGSASMRATVASRERIKAARPAALKKKTGGSSIELDRKHEAAGEWLVGDPAAGGPLVEENRSLEPSLHF